MTPGFETPPGPPATPSRLKQFMNRFSRAYLKSAGDDVEELQSQSEEGSTAVPADVLQLLMKMTERDFYALAGRAFKAEGWAVSEAWRASPGGVVALRVTSPTGLWLVSGRHWRSSRVTEQHVAELAKVVASHGAATGGCLLSCGVPTEAASAAASSGGITVLAGEQLAHFINAAADPEQSHADRG